ncbi:hypothetical protein ACFPT7_07235 [Acidicapsa dinghuensis]|uniref:Uncharacterized protein n=1 Tax=Acidicapsa dinghuensis TaxID=2218256 RepID=A0ABW1EDY7_9BACT|nr:hypothetical protein [Acidicapsa dinghuensis]
MPAKPHDTSSYLGSVALACFIAAFEGLALTRHDITPEVGMTLWIVFTLVLGLTIDVPRPPTAKQLTVASLLPALCLFLALVFKGALQIVSKSVYVTVASIGNVPDDFYQQQQHLQRYGLLYGVIFLITIPGIIAAIYARQKLIDLLSSLISLKPDSVKRVETLTKLILGILGTVGSAAAAFVK